MTWFSCALSRPSAIGDAPHRLDHRHLLLDAEGVVDARGEAEEIGRLARRCGAPDRAAGRSRRRDSEKMSRSEPITASRSAGSKLASVRITSTSSTAAPSCSSCSPCCGVRGGSVIRSNRSFRVLSMAARQVVAGARIATGGPAAASKRHFGADERSFDAERAAADLELRMRIRPTSLADPRPDAAARRLRQPRPATRNGCAGARHGSGATDVAACAGGGGARRGQPRLGRGDRRADPALGPLDRRMAGARRRQLVRRQAVQRRRRRSPTDDSASASSSARTSRSICSLRFNARFRLPNLEEKTYFFIGRDNEREVVTDTPGALSRQDQLLTDRSSDRSFFAGVGRSLNELVDFRLGFRGGLKPYAQARYRRPWEIGEHGLARVPRDAVLDRRDKFGSTTALSYEHSLAPRSGAALAECRDDHAGEHASSNGRAALAPTAASATCGCCRSNCWPAGGRAPRSTVSDYGIQTKWEQPLYRTSLLGELIVGHFWPRRDGLLPRSEAWAIGTRLKLRF